MQAEERAAAHAEGHAAVLTPPEEPDSPSAPPGPEIGAIELSRQIVADMAAARRDELGVAVTAERLAADARVLEARRRADALAEAARRDAREVLRRQLEGESVRISPTATAPAPPLSAPPLAEEPEPAHWTAADDEWLDAEDTVAGREGPATAAHEQFWREEAQASAARAVSGPSPIEVLLPTAALLLLLIAVLLLIG